MNATTLNTPKGNVRILTTNTTVMSIEFCGDCKNEGQSTAISSQCIRELEEYFTGTRKTFSVSLDSSLGTPFQKAVWNAMKEIPYGEVVTYGELAKRAGYPKAVRAVGSACKKNPFPFIVPCHRVLPADKSLGGYAGGAEMKKWLLDIEKKS